MMQVKPWMVRCKDVGLIPVGESGQSVLLSSGKPDNPRHAAGDPPDTQNNFRRRILEVVRTELPSQQTATFPL